MNPWRSVALALILALDGCCLLPDPWGVTPSDRGCPAGDPPSGSCELSETVLCTYSRVFPCREQPPEIKRCACRAGQWQCGLAPDGGVFGALVDASASGG